MSAEMDVAETREVVAVLKVSADELLKHHPPIACGMCKPLPGLELVLLHPRIAEKLSDKLRQTDKPMDTVLFECECGFKRSEPLALSLSAQLKF